MPSSLNNSQVIWEVIGTFILVFLIFIIIIIFSRKKADKYMTEQKNPTGMEYIAKENDKYCKFCGKAIDKNSIYCKKCGKKQ